MLNWAFWMIIFLKKGRFVCLIYSTKLERKSSYATSTTSDPEPYDSRIPILLNPNGIMHEQ